MMAALTTKYSVGDVVWNASTIPTRKQHPCPDCLGSKVWKATSPAGAEFEIACPRCAAPYSHDRNLSLSYSAFAPMATRLTIGSIRIDTAPAFSRDSSVSYMCVESGVGSGTIYDEANLFETEAEALKAAEGKAAVQNLETKWVVEQYNQSLSISDYQLHHAKIKLAANAESRATSLLWNVGDLFNKIEEADSVDEIKEAVHDYRTYDWERDKEKLVEAAS